MDEKTEQLLRELADKLGTTAEHLWGVLLKQAPIEAVTDSVIAAVMLGALWTAYRLVRSKTTEPPASEEDGYPSAEWRQEGAALAWFALSVYGVVTVALVCCALRMVAVAALNPEYWALQQLLP